jgi:hypothetical protein
MYRLRIKGDLEILGTLLNHGEEVPFRKKVQGLGLHGNSFDSKGSSKRVFDTRKDEFLKLKFITPLKTKGKKEKNFAITPLGIAYYCNNKTEPIDRHEVEKIIKMLSFYHDHLDPNDESYSELFTDGIKQEEAWNGIKEIINQKKKPEKLYLNFLKSVLSNITVDIQNETTIIKCNYPLGNGTISTIHEFRIIKENIYGSQSAMRIKGDIMYQISEHGFNYHLSEFILYAFYHTVVYNHIEKYNESFTIALDESKVIQGDKIKSVFSELNSLDSYNKHIWTMAQYFNGILQMILSHLSSEAQFADNILNQLINGKTLETPISIEHAKEPKKTTNPRLD